LPLTACTSNQDCRLRSKSCCECGGATDGDSIIALRIDAEADYARLVCDPDQACDDCVSPLPAAARAECFNGHCTVNGYPGTK
jgi:hypothetical protein